MQALIYLSTRQAAERLGLSTKRINQLAHTHWREHCIAVPGKVRTAYYLVPLSLLADYMRSDRHQAAGHARAKSVKLLKKTKKRKGA